MRGDFMPTRSGWILALAALLALPAAQAQAASKSKANKQLAQAAPEAPAAMAPKKTWDVAVGLGAISYPEYEGADSQAYLPVPYIDVKWKDQVFLNTFDGLGWNAWQGRNFRVGPILTYTLPGDKPAGANDVAFGVQAGAFAEFAFDYYKFDVKLLQSVLGDSEGQRAELGAGVGSKINGNFTWLARLSTTWVSANEMKTYFGLSPREASDMTPKQTSYSPGAGFKDATLSLRGSYDITPHWLILGEGKYARLLGEAADSPLVTKFGNENQFGFWAAAAYRF
ncbi:MAG: MipA/OmpV family protein [Rhodospirillales bacterium]|nr:MAG: MipA/OmpV family protein [Rhodospirillales bacterium]